MAVLKFGGLAAHDQVTSTGERALENPINRDLQSDRTGIWTDNDPNHSQSWLRRPNRFGVGTPCVVWHRKVPP